MSYMNQPSSPGLATLFNDDSDLGMQQQEMLTMPGNAQKLSLDPFLMQGDEHTWDLADWNWDSYNLFAAPKDVSMLPSCCQAFKGTAPPSDLQQRETVSNCGACSMGQAVPKAAAVPQGNSCCSVQVPSRGPVNSLNAAMQQPYMQKAPLHAVSSAELQLLWQPQVQTVGSMFDMDSLANGLAPWPLQAEGLAAPMQAANALPSQVGATPMSQLQSALPSAGLSSMPFNQQLYQQQQPSCNASIAPVQVSHAWQQQEQQQSAAVAATGNDMQVQKGSSIRAEAHAPQGKARAAGSKRKKEACPSDVEHSDYDDEIKPAHQEPISFEGLVHLSDVLAEGMDKMTCQVPGCGKDLTHLKEYHQRYRICEVHIKLPQVVKDGRLQRFCQQCGRFHDLAAFDGNRKSCREQLSKHNARRRRRAQIEQQKAKAAEAAVATGTAVAGGGAGAAAAGAAVGADPAAMAAAAAAAGEGGGAAVEVRRLLASLMQNPSQLHALRLLLGVQTNPALPVMQPFSPESEDHSAANCPNSAGGHHSCSAVSEPASYSIACDILQGRQEFAPRFDSEHKVLRVSMKLFNKTPADLPQDLKQQVTSWLAAAPAAVEGFIRPGCVFLTMNLLVQSAVYAQAMEAGLLSLVNHLLHATQCPFWWQGMYTIQLGVQLATVTNGELTSFHDYCKASKKTLHQQLTAAEAHNIPQLTQLGSICMATAGSQGGGSMLQLSGSSLDVEGLELIVRFRGKQMRLPMQVRSATKAAACLPQLVGCGLTYLEVAKGAYMTPAKPLLVVEDEALAAEVCQLSSGSRAALGSGSVEALLQDLGLVLEYAEGGGVAHVLDPEIVTSKARRILAFACDKGWAAVAQRVLPVAIGNARSADQAVEAIHQLSAKQDNLSLLHRAVRSGNFAVVQGMLHWGKVHGYAWHADRSGPNGITPLHLAALQEDARIALALLDCVPQQAFTCLVTKDGVTPFHLAFQMGHFDINVLMETLKVAPQPAHCHSKARQGVQQQEVDPCEVCHSTLPPLLLSIMANCAKCGMRRPCVTEGCEEARQGCGAGGVRDATAPAAQKCQHSGSGQHSTSHSHAHGQQHDDGSTSSGYGGCGGPSGGSGALPAGKQSRASAASNQGGHNSHKRHQPGNSSNSRCHSDTASQLQPGGYNMDFGAPCIHPGNVYSITALCQSCHSNRVLEVA